MEKIWEQLSPRVALTGFSILVGLPFIVVELFHPQLYKVMGIASYLVFHNITEFFSVMVALSIFGVGWYAYEQSRDSHALFLSTAFLAIGLMDFMHTLGYAGMPSFITPNSANKSTQFWIAVRFVSAAALLGSAFIAPDNRSGWLSKPFLMTTAVSVSGLVFTAVTFFPEFIPATYVTGTGLTPFKKMAEYLIIEILAVAFAAYWYMLKKTGDRLVLGYLAAIILCICSELVFAVYKSVFDTFNVLGHIYKIAAFFLIYRAIFAISVKAPYLKLSAARESLVTELDARLRSEEKLHEQAVMLELEIAERQKTQEELQLQTRLLKDEVAMRSRAQQLMEESHERLFTILNSMDAIVYVADLQSYEVLFANQYVTEIFGDIVGQPCWKSIQLGQTGPCEFCNNSRLLDADGNPTGIHQWESCNSVNGRWYSARDRALHWMDGRIVRMEIAVDITQRKKDEDEIRSLNNDLEQRVVERTTQLEAANRELEAFCYSVSHDLRAPLRNIDAFSQMLLEDYADKLDEQGKDVLQRLRAACQRMAQLIEDMLRLSKIVREEMTFESVDLSNLARLVVDDLRELEPERQEEVAIQDGLTARGDPHLLRAMLENLLGNAWKFTARKEATRIELALTSIDDKPVFFVRDNGAGFDMAYAEKLFAPFQRLHTYSDFAGTGIGLSIVQRIIHRHGGKIWAEGVVGQGATFYFTLPNNGVRPADTCGKSRK